jgi:hypothetical protein
MDGNAKVTAVVYDFAGAKSKAEEITFIVQ